MAALGLAGALAAVPAGIAAEPAPPRIEVGRSAVVVNNVIGKFGEAEPKPIKVDDNVLFEEDVTTGGDAKTVIQFRDGSTFALGPNAVVRIDRFVFNPDESVSQKTVTVAQGVFRYISGFAAKNQKTDIKIMSGVMSIRGSVVSGVVTPGVPPLLFVAQGAATFSNDAGSSAVEAGQAIAVPSPTTPPMNPADLPPAVVAQTLQVIQPLLPPQQVQSAIPAPPPQVLAQQGQLNLVPAASQQAQQSSTPPALVTVRANTGNASLANALPLLAKANSVGLLNGAQSSQSPQQQAFLNELGQAAPQAQTLITQTVNAADAAHSATSLSATIAVAQGLSAAGTIQPASAGPNLGGATVGMAPAAAAGTAASPAAGPAMPTPSTGIGGTPGGTVLGATPGILPATGPATAQAVQSAIASPGVSVTPTVLSVSEANPAVSQAALVTALNVLGAGTGAAAQMITSFAQDINTVADCDIDAGKQMASALNAVLQNPQFSSLATNDPSAVALAQATADSVGVTTFTPTGTPIAMPTTNATAAPSVTATTPTATATGTTGTAATSTTATPGSAPTNFGNFGSIVGTGASTSPAS